MPRNDSDKPIIHKAFGRIIPPGFSYEGRPVDENGDYLHEQGKFTPAEAPGTGASVHAKVDPKDWPNRETLKAVELPELKAWAIAQDVKFHPNSGLEKVLDAIDAARAAGAGTNDQ